MGNCSSCNVPLPPEARFCPGCGGGVESATFATRTQVTSADSIGSASTSATGSPAAVAADTARFLPGMVLAGRYRIVALLGRGGMGEVYRADDLKLGESVALKFLPEGVSHDPERRARLLDEVKLARAVGHPAVCRVYDVGETDGLLFLSMEYVDGENLASLLRRVGRLPEDRAIQVAREICAGLSAAHEKGILHRDLKPANVMIDGRGRARLTDFGLASLAGQVGPDDRSGTPAYMAPEQLAGGEVTVRSDVYSLGLVLYELFTGKFAYAASTLDDLLRMRNESAPTNPSNHVVGLDPAVERTILRCLEADPAARPPSTLAVAAGLPGGDPLARALAAGETPSPELVAAAGGAGTLRPAVGAACLAFVALGVLVCARVADWVNPLLRLPEKPLAVLTDRAEGFLRAAGYPEPRGDRMSGLDYDLPYLNYLATRRAAPELWSPVYFWYRESPRPMVTIEITEGGVGFTHPRPVVPGMAGVRLDGQGRLLELLAVPSGGLPAAMPAGPFDWRPVFHEARLDLAQFQPVAPEVVPPVFADERRAWVSSASGSADGALRVEAGSFQGRPVYFRLVRPWDTETPPRSFRSHAGYVALGFLLVGGVLARRNLHQGRGDAHGALVLGALAVVGVLLGWVVLPGRLAVFRDPAVVFLGVALALLVAVLFGVSYLALEPIVRHHWPHTMTSWQRLITGGGRDPRVSRDLLFGLVAAIPIALIDQLGILLEEPGLAPPDVPLSVLLGTRQILANIVRGVSVSALTATLFMLLLVVLRVLIRRQWAAAVAAVVLLAAYGTGLRMPLFPLRLLLLGVVVFVLLRWGLVAAAVALAGHRGLSHTVLTTHLGAWYADPALVAIGTTLGVAVYGFVTSRARPPARLLKLASRSAAGGPPS